VVGLVGLGITLFSASAAFAQLQSTLNRVWKLKVKPGAAVFVVAFGAMYRVLPDADIPWRDAVRGGILTTGLFLAGKYVIGIYIEQARIGGAYPCAAPG
jgi:membrane protein